MPRSVLAAATLALAACSTPTQQAAPAHQTVIPRSEAMRSPSMPFACDLEAAPLGRWADYEEKHPLLEPIKTHFALVGKGADGITIEKKFEGPGFPDVVMAFVFPPGQGPPQQLRKTVMQDGAFDPMEMPPSPWQDWRLDPRSLVGSEDVTVRAGSFHAKRYHYRTRFDENVDAWIGDTAWPICLIKLDAEQKQMPDRPGRFSYELVATGADAKPRITRSVVPYDLELLRRREDERRLREHWPDNAPRVGDTFAP